MSATLDIRADSESPKRKAILEAATELFMAHGYGAVSMDGIAKAAAVSKATLYAYFTSKDALFATIIGEACQQKITMVGLLPEVGADLRQGLIGFAGRLLRFILDEQPLAIHRVVMSESVRFPELGRAFYDNGPGAFRRTFCEWLLEQTRAGQLAVANPELAADQFMGLLRGGIYLRATLGLEPPPSDAEIDAAVEGAVDVFLKSYGA